MKKVCIVYRSLTNNTENIAKLLASSLTNYEIDILLMDGLDPSILSRYEGILIGAFTWGNGNLHYDCNVFYKKLNRLDLSDKVVGCFGSGDRSFKYFCAAVDLFQEKVHERGATVVSQGLKIHLSPDSEEDFERCISFSKDFIRLLEKNNVNYKYKNVYDQEKNTITNFR